MNKSFLFTVALAGSILGTGCVGTGPNTQQGAVAGGAIGALAGAIIGNNSHGGNGLAGALIGGTAGAIAGGAIGNSADMQNGTLYGAPRSYGYGYRAVPVARVPQTPPPPTGPDVVSAPPTADALWVPGYWAYDGARYSWQGAHWEIPPPRARAYVVAHWEPRGDRYVFVQSYWR
jgi:WXXGXW repeat (2 copies)